MTRTPRNSRWSTNRSVRAALGWWSGLALLVAGVFLAFGVAVSLMVAGVAVAATFLLIYDVDEQNPDDGIRVR